MDVDVHVAKLKRRGCEGRSPRAFGAEKPKAEPGEGEMNGNRNDKQYEDACLGNRLIGDAIKERTQCRHCSERQ